MKVAIIGAGGIGCYYGARLQKAGHEVTYVARGEHLRALQKKGLTLTHPNFSFKGPVDAVDLKGLVTQHKCEDFDLIILTVKSIATAEVMSELSDWLREDDCPILSLQNGVDNEQIIADYVGVSRTLGGLAVRIGGHIIKPGVIEATGVAQVHFGQWPTCTEFHCNHGLLDTLYVAFVDADIDATLSDNIQYELWRKLLINNGVNPISAVVELDTKRITGDPVLGKYVYQIMQETARASHFDGVSLSQRDVDEMFDLISNFDAIKTSMLVDLEKGRSLELNDICGAVISRCEKLNQPAEVTTLFDKLVRVKCEQRGIVL